MENYIGGSLREFLNQKSDETFGKYWKDEEFWEKVAGIYFPEVKENFKKSCLEKIYEEYKEVRVKVNNKQLGYIFLLPDMSPSEILDYALSKAEMTREEISAYNWYKVDLKIVQIPWIKTNKDPSVVHIQFGTSEPSPPLKKKFKDNTEILTREKEDEAFCEKASKTIAKIDKLPDGLTWADVYEMAKVTSNPAKKFGVGAVVKTIMRIPKDKENPHYGYIRSIKYNSKDRPIELEIRTFDGDNETWIWRGNPKNGGWYPEKEIESLKQRGESIRKSKYKTLQINPHRFKLCF